MPQEYLIQQTTLNNIADAVRHKGNNYQELTGAIECLDISTRIDDMSDLQFFVISQQDTASDNGGYINNYISRYHGAPGFICVTNKVNPNIEGTPLYNYDISFPDGGNIGSNAIVNIRDIPNNTTKNGKPYFCIPCISNYNYNINYSDANTNYVVIGFYEEPKNNSVGIILDYNVSLIETPDIDSGLIDPTPGVDDGSDTIQSVLINSQNFKYLVYSDCSLSYPTLENYYTDSNEQHYIISADKPVEEDNLLWIKINIDNTNENAVPILYNTQMHDAITTENTQKKSNNIYINPESAKWCIKINNDYIWAPPAEANLWLKNNENQRISYPLTQSTKKINSLSELVKHPNDQSRLYFEPSSSDEGLSIKLNQSIGGASLEIETDDITSIRDYGFYSHSQLVSINASNCLYIGANAFTSCINLTTAWFPNCTSVSGGSACFTGATSIANGALGTPTVPTAHPFKKAAANLESVYFPNASLIGSSAFTNNKKLHTVNAPKAATISANAFQSCTSLANLTLGLSIVDRTNHRIAIKSAIQNLSFPACTYINGYTPSTSGVFYGYSNLATVDFPVCTIIGQNAFYNCSSLTSVKFPVCQEIGSNAFAGCTSLTSVNFSVCQKIGDNAFLSCSSLIQITLPSLKSFGYIGGNIFYPATAVFRDCTNLNEVNLPICEHLGYSMFYGCNNLMKLTLGYSSIVELHGQDTFVNTPILDSSYTGSFGSIYVPSSLVTQYRADSIWSFYSSRITALENLL